MMKLLSYKFVFYDQPEKYGVDGYVEYSYKTKIDYEDKSWDEWYEGYIRQPFSRRGSYNKTEDNFTELIWGWDGNKENPTLNPSFLCDWRPAGILHLWVKNGKLDILGDTTVDCSKTERIE